MRDINAQTTRLIALFDLASEVDEFVLRRAGELARRKHEFGFSGTRLPCECGEPHIPHVTAEYDTVRYGRLQYYCLGAAGDGLEVVVEKFSAGSPDTPGRARGYWVGSVS